MTMEIDVCAIEDEMNKLNKCHKCGKREWSWTGEMTLNGRDGYTFRCTCGEQAFIGGKS